VGFKEQFICSHKYKTTVLSSSLSAVWKFFLKKMEKDNQGTPGAPSLVWTRWLSVRMNRFLFLAEQYFDTYNDPVSQPHSRVLSAARRDGRTRCRARTR